MRYPWLPMLSLMGMGFYIAIAIILGIWGGHWLDGKMNTSPLWLIIGLFLGIAVAALGVYNMIKPFIQEAKKPDNNKKDKDNK
ncbi:MAG: AtpZ/AtpI family protein [Dehalococcoidales bacterium]